MNTWFHGVANLTLAQKLTRRAPWLRPGVVFYASLIPDAPLFVLTLWYFAVYGLNFGPAYDGFYYEHPLWIISHNMFHAPIIIAAIAAAGFTLLRTDRGGGWPLSFAFGTGLHSLLDVVSHHDDGPLLFFPFDWSTRFTSPVSYWDPEHYGLWVMPAETVITIVLSVYLIRRRRRTMKASAPRSPLRTRASAARQD